MDGFEFKGYQGPDNLDASDNILNLLPTNNLPEPDEEILSNF